MESLVIIISDDLDVFKSIKDAESYLEPWILDPKYNFRAFDQNGNVLTPTIENKKWLGFLPSKVIKLKASGHSNPEKLKEEVTAYLSNKNHSSNLNEKSLSDLLSDLVKTTGITS